MYLRPSQWYTISNSVTLACARVWNLLYMNGIRLTPTPWRRTDTPTVLRPRECRSPFLLCSCPSFLSMSVMSLEHVEYDIPTPTYSVGTNPPLPGLKCQDILCYAVTPTGAILPTNAQCSLLEHGVVLVTSDIELIPQNVSVVTLSCCGQLTPIRLRSASTFVGSC